MPVAMPDRVEDVAQAGVVEDDVERIARRRVEQRRRRLPRRLRSCWIVGCGRDASARSRMRRSISSTLPAICRLRRVELAGAAVLAQRVLELAARLEHARLIEVQDRRVDHRALERDLVVGAVGILLHAPGGSARPRRPSRPARAALSPRPNARLAPQPASEHGDSSDGSERTSRDVSRCIIVLTGESSGVRGRRGTPARPSRGRPSARGSGLR